MFDWKDKDIVLTAIRKGKLKLQDVSDELKNDKYVVLTVVKFGAFSLQYESKELKNDFKIVNKNKIINKI